MAGLQYHNSYPYFSLWPNWQAVFMTSWLWSSVCLGTGLASLSLLQCACWRVPSKELARSACRPPMFCWAKRFDTISPDSQLFLLSDVKNQTYASLFSSNSRSKINTSLRKYRWAFHLFLAYSIRLHVHWHAFYLNFIIYFTILANPTLIKVITQYKFLAQTLNIAVEKWNNDDYTQPKPTR